MLARAALFVAVAAAALAACGRGGRGPEVMVNVEWTGEALPVPAEASDLEVLSVRASGHDDVWVLASATVQGSVSEVHTLAFRFDGRAWAQIELPERARRALWPLGGGAAWAVGNHGVVAHLDGGTWARGELPVAYDLVEVAAWPGSVWVGAAGAELHHYDGSRWDTVAPEVFGGRVVRALWGTGPNDVWAALAHRDGGGVAHFDGTTWTFTPLGRRGSGVVAIGGSAPDDVWALASRGPAWRWDGARWNETPLAADHDLWAISSAGPTEAYVVGERGAIQRWDGVAWRASESGTRARLRTVVALPGGRVWAGGAAGLLRRSAE